MRIRKTIKTVVMLACIGTYGYSAFNTNSGQACNVSIYTSKPLSIVWPAEVAVVGDNGEKGFRIGPNIGRGWRDEAGGEASYQFYIPQEDKYYIWAYSLWYDECANAVFAKIDDLEKSILGNDPVYKKWHWVRGFEIYLRKGTHKLILSNHSDHISLQKLFLTNSRSNTPEDCNEVFSDIFYDGFDGCDQGNFSNWKVISDKWLVQNPKQQMCLKENALLGKSEDDSFIIYKGDDWSNYSLNMIVQPGNSEDTKRSIAMCFGVKDPNQYHELIWRPTENPSICQMQMNRIQDKTTETLADFETLWKTDQWNQVEIILKDNSITVRINDDKPFEIPKNYKVVGGIGLRLAGKINAYFDDIHVRQITEDMSRLNNTALR